MSGDLISRQAALLTLKIFDYDIIPSVLARQYVREMLDTLYVKLNEIPSAKPERKKGKWIWADGVRCSRCYYKLQKTGIPRYCPNCGAEMRGDR